jgi:hypothetical protein
MANRVKTYEEFTGSKQLTAEGIKAYAEYIKAATSNIAPLQTSNVWPSPKK